MDYMKKNIEINIEKNIEKAKEIIKIVQRKLMYEDSAVMEVFDLLKPVAVVNDILLESDGNNLFFNAENLIDCYKEHKLQDLERRYMHILLHGILGHFTEREGYMHKDIIDVVFDFQIENIMRLLNKTKTCNLDNCRVMYEKIKNNKGLISAETISKIHQDEHGLWGIKNKLIELEEADNSSSNETEKKWENARNSLSLYGESGLSDLCKNIGENQDGQRYGHQYGLTSGDNEGIYSAKGRATGDYYSILKDFFYYKEGTKEDVNTIDKILYSYGFDNYGNVALVEPDEENTKKSLHNIVIAMDTSGSCESYIGRFMAETIEILDKMSGEIGFEAIYVIQADAEITDEKRYESIEDLQEKLESDYIVMGFGGTNFCPVFKRCDELCEEGKIIDCLIYFSDGEGSFPTDIPTGYETFFVIPHEDDCTSPYNTDLIPEWVKKTYIKL